ncbi:MAG: type II toxin-antitoxin system VapC family toxin [Sphingomicrobium sp.]
MLDASAFAPVLLEDEASRMLPGLVEALTGPGMAAPAHWRIEVANLLWTAVRRGRLGLAERPIAVQTIAAAVIEFDRSTDDHLYDATWRLAEAHSLTIYDAAYLELALRRGLPLATHDAQLIAAAAKVSVSLYGQ